MENLLGALAGFVIVIFILGIGIYIAQAIFLNKFNRLVNGKGTAMAWIPIFNIYLLGKLTVNKLVGWVLVGCVFLTGTYTTTINGVETSRTILPEGISSVVATVYGLAVLGLFIYAIIKYNKIKKSGITNVAQTTASQLQNVVQQPTQTVAPQPQNVVQQPTQTIAPQPQNVVQQPTQTFVPQPQNVVQQPTQQSTNISQEQQNPINNNPFNNGIM